MLRQHGWLQGDGGGFAFLSCISGGTSFRHLLNPWRLGPSAVTPEMGVPVSDAWGPAHSMQLSPKVTT